MSKFIIVGGNRLEGEIECSGAKNAATPLLASTLLFNERCVFDNMPKIRDAYTMIDLLHTLGCVVADEGKGRIEIDSSKVKLNSINTDLVSRLRSSVLLVGPMLARFGEINLPEPGGCLIGVRPLNSHIDAFRQLGFDVEHSGGEYAFRKVRDSQNEIVLPEFSVTATENIIMYCAVSEGERIMHLAACEPHVMDLIKFLNNSGAKIEWAGPHELRIQGVEKLTPTPHAITPDYLEAGTWAVAAAVTKGSIIINHINHADLKAVVKKLMDIGLDIEEGNDYLRVSYKGPLKPFKLQTMPHPGFPTDLQAPFGLLATLAQGESHIYDTLFEGRLGYLQELEKMGAKIKILNPHEAEISGATELNGVNLSAPDLRAGATMVLAGLAAKGETQIDQAEIIDRGYERIEERLGSIGARITRI